MERKTKIILTRKNSWLNRLRGFKVFIDDQQVGIIRNGGSEEFDVAPGNHKILCKMNWVSSREYEVNITGGAIEYLQVRNGMKYFLIFYFLLLAIFGSQLYLDFAKIPKSSYFETARRIAIIPVFLYFFYYLTFGRKNYLIIAKDDSNPFAG